MAEEREKKRKKSHSGGEPTPSPARDTQDMKAGELLRHVREEKGMELEEVSSAIHVRVVQLRAIEEGHIESLPGMTYALGFVKSYASYLKLDPTTVANKFKAEHSVAPNKPDLKFPEPMAENKMPDPVMIGAAVFGVVVLLAVWFFFSGGEEKTANVASAIPAAPTEIAPLTAGTNTTTPAETAAANTNTTTATAPAVPVGTAPVTSTTQTTVATTAPAATATPAETPAAPAAATPAAPAADAATTETAAAAVSSEALPRPRPAPETHENAQQVAQAQDQSQPAAGQVQPQPQQQETINIHPSRGRVMLEATQSTWVQVTNGYGAIVLKRVLHPGDRYYVPDEPGLSMVTSNAGGLNIYVDGAATGSVGRSGEIVRGISLNPNSLRHGRRPYYSSHNLVHD